MSFTDAGDHNTTFTAPDIKELRLERLLVTAKMTLTGQMAEDLKYGEYLDDVFDRLICELNTCIWAEETANYERSLSYPDGWWEMFKEQYFPYWLKQRFPVRMTKQTWNVRQLHCYPEFEKVFPGYEAVVKYRIGEPKISSYLQSLE